MGRLGGYYVIDIVGDNDYPKLTFEPENRLVKLNLPIGCLVQIDKVIITKFCDTETGEVKIDESEG